MWSPLYVHDYQSEFIFFLVLCHNWIKDGNNLPQVDLSSIKNPRSANNAIGQSINIITQSRQSQNASTLQPVSHKSGKTMLSSEIIRAQRTRQVA